MPNQFNLKRLEPDDPRPLFDCGDQDLNEFFSTDSVNWGRQLLSVTYMVESGSESIGFISLANDSLRREDASRSALKRVLKFIPHEKRYNSTPAVKIGRLAICSNAQGQGYGTDILDYIKAWFTQGNKTGCRFIIVDAYNKLRTIKFYQRNGFDFIYDGDKNEPTRLMYFDLIRFRQ